MASAWMSATASSSSSRTAGLLMVGSTFTTSTLGTSSGPRPTGTCLAGRRHAGGTTPSRESPMAPFGLFPALGKANRCCEFSGAADSALRRQSTRYRPLKRCRNKGAKVTGDRECRLPSQRLKAPRESSGAISGSAGLRLRCRWRWHLLAEQVALEKGGLIGHRTLECFAYVDVEMTDRIA